jgi:hypothetical protein
MTKHDKRLALDFLTILVAITAVSFAWRVL